MIPQIKKIRDQIDQIDSEILQKLEDRFALTISLAKIKIKGGKKIADLNREKEILKKWLVTAKKLEPKFIKNLHKLITKNSRNIQKSIKKKIK